MKLKGSPKITRVDVRCGCGWKGKRDPRSISKRCPNCGRCNVYFA